MVLYIFVLFPKDLSTSLRKASLKKKWGEVLFVRSIGGYVVESCSRGCVVTHNWLAWLSGGGEESVFRGFCCQGVTIGRVYLLLLLLLFTPPPLCDIKNHDCLSHLHLRFVSQTTKSDFKKMTED